MLFSAVTAVALASIFSTTIAAPTVSITNVTNTKPISNQYIVVYKPGVSNSQADQHQTTIHDNTKAKNSSMKGVTSSYILQGWSGYAVQTDPNTLKTIAQSPLVASIEQDGVVNASYYVDQPNANWDLTRISHRYPNSNTSYTYDNTAAGGTYAYVLDTGILTSHQEFQGRAIWGANFIIGAPNTDDNGHGTHCAGSLGGMTYGVAKNVTLLAVKVLDSTGSGSYSGVISGIQWAVADATARGKVQKAVISMSLSGGYSAALNAAVNAAYLAGVPVFVAAGNNGANAGSYSPSSAQYAITVGATDSTDTRASWSNWGSSVTIFAPGVGILSAWNSCNTCTMVESGTSMATPHVAGMGAYLIAKNSIKTPASLVQTLTYLSIAGIVKQAGTGTTQDLLFNGNGDNGGH